MKKAKLLIAPAVIVASLSTAVSQNFIPDRTQAPTPNFFMPASELQPKYEKLPPINGAGQSVQRISPTSAPVRSVQPRGKIKSYTVVDGRYIPVYETEEEEDDTLTPETTELSSAEGSPESENDTLPVDQVSAEQEDVSDMALADRSQKTEAVETLKNLEPYVRGGVSKASKAERVRPVQIAQDSESQNQESNYIYKKYMNDLSIFEQTGQMPADPQLEAILGQMNTDAYTTIFQKKITL